MKEPKTYIKSRCCNSLIIKTSNSYDVDSSDIFYYCAACSKLIRHCWRSGKNEGDIWADGYKDLIKNRVNDEKA